MRQGSRSQRGSATRSGWTRTARWPKLELAWADGGYHGFSAEGGTWCAVSSAGEVLTGGTPDALNRAIRAHWQAKQ